jgi:hypothetical protein
MTRLNTLTRQRSGYGLYSMLLAVAAVGCSDAKERQANQVTTESAFLVGTRVWNDSATTSYFNVVSNLSADTVVDPATALEVSGSAKLYAVKGIGWFAVGGGEQPTITRYVLSADGRLTQDAEISLQPFGVKSLWETLYVVSPTKIYYPDRAGNQLIVINPTQMSVIGTIQLSETVREGYLSVYGYAAIERAGKLLISVGWFDWENDKVLGETGLVTLDSTNDAVVHFETDTRCGGVTQPIIMKSGDAYLASSALAASAHRLGRLTTKPCALRIPHASNSFDPNYALELDHIVAAPMSGEPVPGSGDSVFLRVFDESLGSVDREKMSWDLTGQTAWRWWQWNPTLGTANVVAELPPATADVLWFQVDGRVIGAQTSSDYAQTTLVDLTAANGPEPLFTAPGFVHGIARVR